MCPIDKKRIPCNNEYIFCIGEFMAQVLKEKIYDRIFQAGLDVFYEKDFRSAKMQDIAARAHIPVGLIYTYFKNKEALFDKIASSVSIDFKRIAREEEAGSGLPSERYKAIAEGYLLDLLKNHKAFVVLMDKSCGTKYECVKQDLIAALGKHIKKALAKTAAKPYHGLLVHILASNFAESLLEVARHYENQKRAAEMLRIVAKCYYEGVNAL